jgi:hypothetical protein
MQYALLKDLDIDVRTFVSGETIREGQGQYSCRSIAGAFFGIENGTGYFGFNENSPSDAEYMAGVMSRDVAHP